MIVFGGGNASTFLNEVNRTGFSEPLKQAIENGLVYLGISAGSMIAAGNYLLNPGLTMLNACTKIIWRKG